MIRKILKGLALACAAIAPPGALFAGEWTVGGLGIASSGTYDGSQFALAPIISFEHGPWGVSFGEGLSYRAVGDAWPAPGAKLVFSLAPRFAPGFPDGPLYDGLSRDIAYEAVGRGRMPFGDFFVEAEARQDVSDVHGGREAKLTLGRGWRDLGLEAGLGATYRSADLNQHLFGVSANEAAAGRPAYTAQSTLAAHGYLFSGYRVNAQMSLFGILSHETAGGAEDSPLVNEGGVTALSVGLVYTFR